MKKSTKELLESGHRRNSPSYAPADVIFERGEGVYLYDSEGREYLDFMAGIAVNCLGYNHPRLTEAVASQAARLLHVSNLFFSAEQIELMELLCERSFGDRVFLCNSGAEANEAAFKLARRYQFKVAGKPEKTEIVSMSRSFHGRTIGAITATGQPKYHEGFAPLVPGFVYGEFNDLEQVQALIGEQTAAVIVEPIQGEGGIRPAEKSFLEGVRKACDAHGALLIFDEVQTGVGRSGALFAYQRYGVEPDIMSLAKGLGGGVPIGAMVATSRAFEGWDRGSHASTFGGNPLVCAASKTVLEVIQEQDLCTNALERGEQLVVGLKKLAERFDVITDVRGMGLMVGAECAGSAAPEIVARARDAGLVLNTAGGNTLRMVPPLIVTAQDVEEGLRRLEQALSAWSGN